MHGADEFLARIAEREHRIAADLFGAASASDPVEQLP
jgi:hypothetical protein